MNRVWASNGAGLLVDPVSVSVSRDGMAALEDVLTSTGGADHAAVVFAIEATGSLHRPWASELERRHPGTVRVFAPS